MNCPRLSQNRSVRDRWHRLWCAECRRARGADARIAELLSDLRAAPLPEGGREQVLAALGLTPARASRSHPARALLSTRWLWSSIAIASTGMIGAALLFARPGRPPARPMPGSLAWLAPGRDSLRLPPRLAPPSSGLNWTAAKAPGVGQDKPGVVRTPRTKLPEPGTPVAEAARMPGSPGGGAGWLWKGTALPQWADSPAQATIHRHVSPRSVAPGLAPHRKRPGVRPPPIPDEKYLDGRDPGLMAYWSGGEMLLPAEPRAAASAAPPGDDFVFVPFPRLASAAPDGGTAMSEAVQQYEREKQVVDERLFRKVTLAQKASSLDDVCQALEKQTGVRLAADRIVADEKATVLVNEEPARDVMRALARLFGYHWLRSGEPGAYRYELTQDLRSRLAEEEMRNRDLNEALADLDDRMAEYRPYLQKSLDQLREEGQQASGPEKERLHMLVQEGGLAALQVYNRLTPDQFTALKSGVEQKFGYSPWDTNRLPDEWRALLLQSMPANMAPRMVVPGVMTSAAREGATTADQPGIMPFVILKINRSELGTVTLEVQTGLSDSTQPGWPGLALTHVLATGRSPSAAKPGNEKANAALRGQPLFQRRISIRPQPSCPRLKREAPGHEAVPPVVPVDQFRRAQQGVRAATGEQELTERPHVTSADVWEAVHKATGLPIVADSYTRIYPVPAVTGEQAPLFEALCQVADELGVRWKKDDDFLLCRSTGYFWNKLKEVPNRLLARWQVDSRRKEGLPLEDVIEMASLSDNQLDSAIVAQAIEHCWELDEWGLVGGRPKDNQPVRPYARFLALLTSDQRARSRQPGGLSIGDLSPPQQQELARLWTGRGWPAQDLAGARLRVDYAPSGWYVWRPLVKYEERHQAEQWPLVASPDAAAALAAARRLYPAAAPEQIQRGDGALAVTVLTADGKAIPFGDRPESFMLPARAEGH